MTINKQKTALMNAYIHQQNSEVERFMFAAPFITNTDYNNLVDEIANWVALSQTGYLFGTNEDNSTFQFDEIGSDTIPPKR